MSAITDGLELVSESAYGNGGVPHEVWTRLRAEAPVSLCESGKFEPFWAITKHADICEISRQPDKFSNVPGINVGLIAQPGAKENPFSALKGLIVLDPPLNRQYRKVASPVFTPRAVTVLDDAVDTSAREVVDRMVEWAGGSGSGECEFASDIAAAHPLRILSTMLGVPREREPDILRLTNELFAPEDPDLQRAGDDRDQAVAELALEFYQLFDEIIQDRRANPTEDLASVLANGQVNGCPMEMLDAIGYYLIIFTAGHDTTKNALAGGMRAFAENPDQFALLKERPELIDSAVEEVIRWTSPVNYMKRTAKQDYQLRGRTIKAGDSLLMFYASANRDEDVFENPFDFRIDRSPNRHVGFGFAEHFCLGANLARRSMRALWLELSERLDSIELAGEPEQIHSSFVVGMKKLPIRYRVSAAG